MVRKGKSVREAVKQALGAAKCQVETAVINKKGKDKKKGGGGGGKVNFTLTLSEEEDILERIG